MVDSSCFATQGVLGNGTFGQVLLVQSKLDGCNFAMKVRSRPRPGDEAKPQLSVQCLSATGHLEEGAAYGRLTR